MALNKTAFSKRADQLKRFEESETNRQSILPKNISDRKVRFSSGCIFLASCVAGEKDEVLNMLNCGGADIDTANIDGLTALHQACIEDNLDMVEFLVTHRADINRKDNEGWTPLHATSSCGILSIARYLVENGADLASVNSDGELPIDIAGTNAMAELLQQCIDEQEIDCDEARQQEEKMMLADAKKWLRSDASEADRAHPKTGATALHVAAAKGYTKVLSLLLAGRADVDRQDNDGWTPLHAATYWGKKEAAQMLIASMADMDIQNYSGQTAIDIAPKDMVAWLEELKKTNKRTKRRPVSQIRISDSLDNNIESPPKVIRVEVKPEKDANKISEVCSESEESESEESSSSNESEEEIDETQPIKNAVARDQMQLSLNKDTDTSEKDAWRRNATKSNTQNESPPKIQVPDKENQTNDSEVILRRTQSFENDEKFYQKYIELRARIKANSCPVLPATPISGVVGTGVEGVGTVKPSTNFIIQRSASLKDHRSQLLSKKSNPVSPPTSPSTPSSTPASTPVSGQMRRTSEQVAIKPVPESGSNGHTVNHNIIELIARRYSQPTESLSTIISNSQAIAKAKKNSTNEPISPPSPTLSVEKVEDKNGSLHNGSNGSINTQSTVSAALTKLSPTNIFKNFFKSFVPPTRDEESETQRKAHAKRVRETRRSTQGVTLDEIKSAEQLVKMKNANNNNNNGNNENSAGDTINDRIATPELTSEPAETELNTDEVVTNYTISSPLRKTMRTSVDKDDDAGENGDTKITATFTITPPPKPNVTAITMLANKLEKDLDSESNNDNTTTSVTATINVPLIANKSDLSDRIKKTDLSLTSPASSTINQILSSASPTSPKRRSLFDIDNATSMKLADKLQQEAMKCDANAQDLIANPPPSPAAVFEEKFDQLPPSPIHTIFGERRPSWRLKCDYSSKFKLEDSSATNPPTSPTHSATANGIQEKTTSISAVAPRRQNSTENVPSNSEPKESSSTEVTPNRCDDDKENDKENDSRGTQSLIQRRRRPKRRSTGVVHVDMEDIDNEYRGQESPVDNGDDKEISGTESRSRINSVTSSALNVDTNDDGEFVDYKALYEAAKAENDKLKGTLKGKEQDLVAAKSALERLTAAATKSSLSENEKREKRAMERKISEMEEELKQMDVLKTENQRLKDENGALIRVISKLSK